MTNTDSAKHEFEHVLENLNLTVDAATAVLLTPNPEHQSHGTKETLEMLLEYQEQLRPISKTKEKEASYNFSTAVPKMVKARMLIVKLKAYIPKQPLQQPEIRSQSTSTILKLVLKSFDGDITKYSTFKVEFNAAIGNQLIPITDELLYLIRHLTDQPAKLLENIPVLGFRRTFY